MEKMPVESELTRVAVRYLVIGFVDSDKFEIALVGAFKDPRYVTMGKSRNRDGYAFL
jgi:hypothetical protein